MKKIVMKCPKGGFIVKSKKYEDDKTFERWWSRHTSSIYGRVYDIKAFVLTGGGDWREIRAHTLS